MHGWCAEKENRGKGGSGKGKIGAGVVSCQSMDPVGTQSSRAPILAFLGTAFGPSGSSRAPIFEFLAPRLDLSGSSKNHPKTCKNTAKMLFFTGQKRCPKMLKLVPDWVPTGSRLGPDWIPTGFLQKNTYFPKFEHLFLKF